MNNMIWDAVLWLRKKLNRDKEDIIQAVNNIQNLFETSIDATASASDIMEGKTAYNGTALLTGIIKDQRGGTVTARAVTQDENYTYLSIPEDARYDANSKVRTQNSNLNDTIYDAIKAAGVTPASKNYADLATAINTLSTNRYNAGYSAGRAAGKTISVYLSGSAEYTDGSWKGRAEATIAGQHLTAHAGQSLNTSITV